MSDELQVVGLEVAARVGVPEAERAAPQRLEIDIALEGDLRGLGDDLGRTTDYSAVAAWVTEECASREFRLIESLAEHLAAGILRGFPRVAAVRIAVRKFVLPQAKHVGVSLRREKRVVSGQPPAGRA